MESDLRAFILGLADSHSPAVLVPIPEWGGVTVGVRRLSLHERLAFETSNGAFASQSDSPERQVQWMVRYVIATACREDGAPLFHPEDEETLTKHKSGTALVRLVREASKVNGSSEEVVQMGKDSVAAPNGSSSSVSPATSG